MCTATAPTRYIVDQLERRYASAVFAGIVPDQRHLDQGGFHVCLLHLKAHNNLGDYSSAGTLDGFNAVSVAGRGYSCAFDVSLAPADMKRLYAAVKKVHADKTDPRRKFVNAINCWKGSGHPERFNFQTGTVTIASEDHTTHTHGDQPRVYVDVSKSLATAEKAARAVASIMTGESKAAWIAREEPKPPVAPGKAPSPAPATWPVKAGDTLFKISAARKVSVANLQKWNNIRGTTIYVGQTLRLTAPPTVPVVVKPSPVLKPPAWPVGAKDFFRPSASASRYATVEKWQARMKVIGWAITADGYPGPKTGVVITAFQRSEGLKVTKVLDLPTFNRAWTTKRRSGK